MPYPMIVLEVPRLLSLLSVVIRIRAMTIWPILLTKEPLDEQTLRHEAIHCWQQIECAIFATVLVVLLYLLTLQVPLLWLLLWAWMPAIGPFYLIYYLCFFIGWVKYRDKVMAYDRIPFEQEAVEHEVESEYLRTRSLFAWVSYRI